eukprot:scaffold395603_cov29-Prasinocladus_malaysianus.AAC.1
MSLRPGMQSYTTKQTITARESPMSISRAEPPRSWSCSDMSPLKKTKPAMAVKMFMRTATLSITS